MGLFSGKKGLVFGVAYLLNPTIQAANWLEFHPVTLAPTFLMAAFYFLVAGRAGWFAQRVHQFRYHLTRRDPFPQALAVDQNARRWSSQYVHSLQRRRFATRLRQRFRCASEHTPPSQEA